MPRVTFTAHLRRHVEAPALAVEGATVGAALDAAFARHPVLRGYVLDEQGRLRKHVALWVNAGDGSRRAALADAVGAGDEIFVLQALSGG